MQKASTSVIQRVCSLICGLKWYGQVRACAWVASWSAKPNENSMLPGETDFRGNTACSGIGSMSYDVQYCEVCTQISFYRRLTGHHPGLEAAKRAVPIMCQNATGYCVADWVFRNARNTRNVPGFHPRFILYTLA